MVHDKTPIVINAAPTSSPATEPTPTAVPRGIGSPTPSTATPATRWPSKISGLCRLCHVAKWEDPPAIWHALDPLSKLKARTELETEYGAMADQLGYDRLFVTHVFALLVMSLTFWARDPCSLESAVNLFLLPDMAPDESDDAIKIARQWDVVLRHGMPTSFNNATRLF